MSNIAEKAIYMSLRQLLIIFYQRKVDNILMPDAMSELNADDRELKQAMAKMIGEGLLVTDKEGKLTLSKEAGEIADIIAGAHRIFHIGNKALPQRFLYEKDGRGVLMNLDPANPEKARLELGDAAALIGSITEYEGMPDETVTGEASAAEPGLRDMSLEQLMDIPDVVTAVDRYLRGSEKSELRVVVRRGVPFILTLIKDETEDCSYDPELFVKVLMEEE